MCDIPLCSVLFAQVLEPCKDNKIFRPPNPWIMGILTLCAEIYALDNLKLNLKFEIEMLFRNMNITIGSIQASLTVPVVVA